MQEVTKYADYMNSAQRVAASIKLSLEMDNAIVKLKERSKRHMLRKINEGEVQWDKQRKCFVYTDTEQEMNLK
jgi:hypothetical protein